MRGSQSQKSAPNVESAHPMNLLELGVIDDVLNPLIGDSNPVGTPPRVLKVFSLIKARHRDLFL